MEAAPGVSVRRTTSGVAVGDASRYGLGVGVLVGRAACRTGGSTAGLRVGVGATGRYMADVGSGATVGANLLVGSAVAVGNDADGDGVTAAAVVGVGIFAASTWRVDAASPRKPRLYSHDAKRKRANALPAAIFLRSLN